MKTSIWWIRRDLRLRDNLALQEARLRGEKVIPLFILDPSILNAPHHREAKIRQAFMYGGLRALDQDLRDRGGRLFIRQGDPIRVLTQVVEESGAAAICAEEDYSPYARRRDREIAQGLPLHLAPGVCVHPPGGVTRADGHPYVVFTPFRRAWGRGGEPSESGLLPAPESWRTIRGVGSIEIPDAPGTGDFPPGEREALQRLEAFTRNGIFRYAHDRDQLAVAGTSMLSPYLRFGMISARAAIVAARGAENRAGVDGGARAGVEAWIGELVWREFYESILFHFPGVLRDSFREKFRGIRWARAGTSLQAWQEGQTGFPVVDAGMRQLGRMGWMHNRARMITASFLVKDLLLDWREGESWFMRRLVDGDPAANNGGWQWVAGVGTDAAPYFRVFNPLLQSRRFDGNGNYIRRWVPELRDVPDRYIHEPSRMPPGVQRQAGCRIGKDYPKPLVNHALARQRLLQAYRCFPVRR
jgi:deoxyribodipyrimidine photo-lyase